MTSARLIRRCPWAATELSIAYHDSEWGVPQHDDRILFEFLLLEGAQAGLSWETILKKRENYRLAFDGFNPAKIADYDSHKTRTLLDNSGIIRNRLKVAAAIQNARALLKLQEECGTFDAYLWGFVQGRAIQNARRTLKDIPATTTISDVLSKDLRKRSFKFVGSTICYALMQAVGMVNDHIVGCHRYREVKRLGEAR